ncbi:MAG: enoyl-CoA hydratase/isomerase family protein [Dehalococcoidia bacterium]
MTSTEPPPVLFERRGPIGIATLNRPETLNAMSGGMVEALCQIVKDLDEDPEGKVMVLTAAGKGFCSGMDVADMGTDPTVRKSPVVWPRPRPDRQPVTVFREANIPIIAAVNGVAAGAGMSLALGADLRIMSDRARFYPIFLKRGLMPDMGLSFTLTKLVGSQKALELIWNAEPIDPDECLRLGLVTKVVPHRQLMDAAMEAAERLAAGPSVAIALAKRSVYRAEAGTLESELEFGSFSQQRLMGTQDFREGYRSFIEKRPPQFKGE